MKQNVDQNKKRAFWKRPQPRKINTAFLKLWSAQTISELGSQVTLLALPFIAIIVLHSQAFEVGMLTAAGLLPYPILALFAGVWVDRLSRRLILISTDWARALLLLFIPLSAYFGFLSIQLLYVVAFLVGVCTVFFDIAYTSFLPEIVSTHEITQSNARIMLSQSIAQVGGPSLGGVLIQVFTAPIAIFIDVFSFLCSAVIMMFIPRIRENTVQQKEPQKHFWHEIKAGLTSVIGERYLTSAVGPISLLNLFNFILIAIFLLYAHQQLNVPTSLLGIIVSVAGAGAIVGSLLVTTITRRVGIGRALIIGGVIFASGPFFVAIAGGSLLLIGIQLIVSQICIGFGVMILDTNALSLRQLLIPLHLQGRAGASLRLLNWGVKPIGAFLGGWLGTVLGLHTTLWIAVIGSYIAALWLLFSPLKRLTADKENTITAK